MIFAAHNQELISVNLPLVTKKVIPEAILVGNPAFNWMGLVRNTKIKRLAEYIDQPFYL